MRSSKVIGWVHSDGGGVLKSIGERLIGPSGIAVSVNALYKAETFRPSDAGMIELTRGIGKGMLAPCRRSERAASSTVIWLSPFGIVALLRSEVGCFA